MKKKNKLKLKKLKGILPYAITGIIVLTLVFVGSLDKNNPNNTATLDLFANENYDISVDQMSELYVVADLSDALGLASAAETASNYVIATSMYDSGQTTIGKTEKPNLTSVNASRGIIEHVVEEGENVNTIAKKYGITAEQLRWSNDLKTDEVGIGTVLKVPSVPGIVYTVKAGETVDSIAKKYGSTPAEIIALNDLEISGISEGMKIVIKGGVLPANERPEYNAPVRSTTTNNSTNYNYAYTYLGNTAERQNIQVVGWYYGLGGPYAAGQCTQWAWYMRKDIPSSFGNAGSWAWNARAAGFLVNNVPSAGAIFQSGGGYYGHVGYVESVNRDGSIVVTEMNYIIPFRVIRATIPASTASRLNYIH